MLIADYLHGAARHVGHTHERGGAYLRDSGMEGCGEPRVLNPRPGRIRLVFLIAALNHADAFVF